MNDLVSVIIPVYNVEKFVREAVQSIQNQTYSNLEIIIIDDGSTDSTYSLLEEIAQSDPRIKLYKNKKNMKIVKTLNRGLELASGSYILRMDGDDVSTIDRVEVLMEFLKSNPCYSLVGSAYSGINEIGDERGASLVPTSQETIDKILLLSSPVSHIWLAKKEVYTVLNGYRADTVEDYDFLLRMHSENLLFTNVPNVLYRVRLRDGNTASTQGLKQAKAFQYVLKLYKERVLKGYDSYSEDSFKKYVKSGVLMNWLHFHSQKYLAYALLSRLPLKIFFSALAVVLSPYTAMYLLRRFRYKQILKKGS